MRNRKMQILCGALSAATVLMSMSGTASAAVAGKIGGQNVAVANVEDELFVRSTASASGKVVGFVPGAAGVIVESMQGEWAKIRSGDISGYVKTSYLAFDEQAEELKNIYGVQGAVAAWDDVKVFADPQDTSSVIGTLQEGEGGEILGSTENWVEVQLADGRLAYVAAEDVSFAPVLDTAVASEGDAVSAEPTGSGKPDAGDAAYAEEPAYTAEEPAYAEDCGYAQDIYTGDDTYIADSADWTDDSAAWTDNSAAWTDDSAASWTDDSAAWTDNSADNWTDDSADTWADNSADTWTDNSTVWTGESTDTWTDNSTDTWTDDSAASWTDDSVAWTDNSADTWTDNSADTWTDDSTDSWAGESADTWTDDSAADDGADTSANYSDSDLDLLAALIYCEAGNQSAEGKVAVGQVVMNRVASGSFANSIHDVIYESGQFTPASTGWLDSVIGSALQDCYDAAAAALNGEGTVGDALYFNTGSGKGQKIGDHQFY